MDEGMEKKLMMEPFEADEFEIDFDYEFDAPQYYHFTHPETVAQAIEAESWFDSAASHPPSPLVEKMDGRYDVVSISRSSRGEFGSDADDSDIEIDLDGRDLESSQFKSRNVLKTPFLESCLEGSDGGDINKLADSNLGKGQQLCNGLDQDILKAKPKSLVKPFLSRCSTLMKPTASYLAKQNQLQDVHFNRFLRSQKLLSSQNSSTTENLSNKRQKLAIGYLCKNSLLKHQALFLHKVPKKVGLVNVNSVHARPKVTIPREPNLETAHRAQRHRAKVNAESGENAKSKACTFKERPLNRKILKTSSLRSPSKSRLQPPEFQVFQLRTSERARQHARNNVSTTSTYNSVSQNDTDYRRVQSVAALKEDKCEAVRKVKANSPIKICSSKGECDVFRNIKQEKIVPMEHDFAVDKRFLNEPPVELFSKLSLVSEVHNNLKSQPKIRPLVIQGSKENAPRSCLLGREMNVVKEKSPSFNQNQYQCGSQSNDARITEGGSQFNINRNLDIR